ncbi:hypothetical protein [Kitasatospora fiedleri]|uniref:hypothetical protein n=1 Tax=Kitasatospora fiedleri TaxID=2991545 RepID=UPI00249B0F01|nr:hypothetical protein [Kitasatospora fiedleri]
MLAERRQLTTEATQTERPQAEERRQPTLAERRQAHRDQLQQRGGQPVRATRPRPNHRVEPADQRQAPAQRRAGQSQPVQPRPQQARQEQQGPRLR